MFGLYYSKIFGDILRRCQGNVKIWQKYKMLHSKDAEQFDELLVFMELREMFWLKPKVIFLSINDINMTWSYVRKYETKLRGLHICTTGCPARFFRLHKIYGDEISLTHCMVQSHLMFIVPEGLQPRNVIGDPGL